MPSRPTARPHTSHDPPAALIVADGAAATVYEMLAVPACPSLLVAVTV